MNKCQDNMVQEHTQVLFKNKTDIENMMKDVDHIKTDISNINTKIFIGNGKESLTTRIKLIEEKIDNMLNTKKFFMTMGVNLLIQIIIVLLVYFLK